MAKVEHSVVIKRPVEEVFEFVTNYQNHSLWRSETVEAIQTSKGPTGLGATGREVSQVLGRRIEATAVITGYEPSRKLSAKTTSGPFSIEASHTVESVEDGTRYTLVLEGEPGDFRGLAEPILVRMAQRQIETNLRNLKDLMEARIDRSA